MTGHMLALALVAGMGCTDKGADSGAAGDSGTTAATPTRPEEPAPWEAPGAQDDALWGIAAGDPTGDGARISVRTLLDTVTVVVVADDGAGGWTEVARETVSRDADGVGVQVDLSGLASDTVHAYAFYEGDLSAGGDGAVRSPVGRFRTALAGDDWRTVTVAATSCLGSPGRPWPSMSQVAGLDPDLFLLLGDAVYADGSITLDDYRSEWSVALDTAGMRDMLAATGVVATWDDHEVDNNWSFDTVTAEQYDAALTAFREAVPQQTGPTGGIWRHRSWGDVLDVFVLDVRSERDPDADLYIGAEQEAWLLDGLTSSTAAFKLVMTSVPIVDYEDLFGFAGAEDRWQGWPEQRERVLQAVDDAGVTGLLWISGDVHHAMVTTVGIPGSDLPGQDQWEVTVGAAGSTPNIAADLYENDGTHYRLLFSDWNTALLTLDPGTGQAHVRFVGDDGADLAEITLTP